MAKSILFKFIFFIFSSHVFMLDLKPYENSYFSKPNGTVKEKLEKISDNIWKMTSLGKHPLFTIKQESIFRVNDGNVILESGFRNLDILGGLRKDYQSYKIERKDNQKILTYSHGKKKGTLEILDNFYDNLTLQIQIKLSLLDKDKIEINYLDKGKIKIKTFLIKKTKINYKLETVEVFEISEQREDKRYFRFFIKNDSSKDTLIVSQGGRGFDVDWELD